MTNVRINKAEAARRQVDVAIRLLFNNNDSIAVNTLANASFRIVRDLCDAKNIPFEQVMKAKIE